MPSDLQAILKLDVPVIVRLGERTMRTADVLGLRPGSIIELLKDADDELELMINNEKVGFGSAVKIGENFGIRISHIGDPATRIQAMGGDKFAQASEAAAEEEDPFSRLL